MKDSKRQFEDAYSKDNSRYVYHSDDGTRITYVAGEDGVTEEWIKAIKAMHRAERNLMRCGMDDVARKHKTNDSVSSSKGSPRIISLDKLAEDAGDACAELGGTDDDPEAVLIHEEEQVEFYRQLDLAMGTLTELERRTFTKVHMKGIRQSELAVFNGFITNRSEISESYEEMIRLLTDTAALDRELDKLRAEHEVILALLEKCIQENASTALDQESYRSRYEELSEKFENTVKSIDAMEEKKAEQITKARLMRQFLSTLEKSKGLLTKFDDGVWYATIDSVTVQRGGSLIFHFKDGTDVPYTEQ